MSWRPEGWHLPLGLCDHDAKEGEIVTATLLSEREKVLYEAGADAMLEALFKLAKESPTGTFVIASKVQNCFMQDNEKEGD